jgi:hypothetical protein
MQPLPQQAVPRHRVIRLGQVHKATKQVVAAPFVLLNQVLQHECMMGSYMPGAETSMRWHPHPSWLRPGHKAVVEDDGV